jgi:hypothetical protein
MERTKLFLHPSSYEAFGVVCLEALAGAAHVISFCKPMRNEIPQWYTVGTKDEMIEKALLLLNDMSLASEKVIPYLVADQVKKIMDHFHQ